MREEAPDDLVDLAVVRVDQKRSSRLGPVEIQDSTFGLVVIQAADGTIRTN
jgi:hypothetical protein